MQDSLAHHYAELVVEGKKLETKWVEPRKENLPTIVLLHEALGSLSLWKDFPEQLARRTQCGVLVYSRHGHGGSEALSEDRTIDYIHFEGEVVLPELLDRLNIRKPVLLGHSDGASIAITYAGTHHDGVSGMILMAPHVFVEDITVKGVLEAGIAYQTTDLRPKLSRHHLNADAVFRSWHELWIDPQFRAWSIESYLSSICCPALLIQGEHDGYGSIKQLEAIKTRVPGSELLILPDCGHAPHREQAEISLDCMAHFIANLPQAETVSPDHSFHGRQAGRLHPSAGIAAQAARPSYHRTIAEKLRPASVKAGR